MKPIQFSLVVLVLMIAFFGKAQGLKIGTRISLGQSNFAGHLLNSTGRLYAGFGASADYQFNHWFGIASDAMLLKKGAYEVGTYQSNDVLKSKYNYTENYKFFQAELPVMAKLRIGSEHFAFKAFAGPCIAFNLASVSTRTYDNQSYNNDNGYVNKPLESMNVFEESIIYGIGLEVKSNRNEVLFLDFRNNNGISPIGKINGQNLYTKYSVLSIGWMF